MPASEKTAAVDPKTRALIYTSPSALAKLDPTQEGACERRWFQRYVLRLKEPMTTSQEKGIRGHAQIEHYLPTGEDVLGPSARKGKHLLPAPGMDLLVEWGLNNKPKPKVNGAEVAFFPPEESLLRADGVPVIGFTDWINPRGVYVSPEGELRNDPEGTVEIGDNKFTSDLKWAKASDALIKTTQMTAYAEFLRELHPPLTHARISHVVFQNDAKAAVKRTALIPVATVKNRWYEAGHSVARRMREVARAGNIEEIPIENRHAPGTKNDACKAFRGCAFQSNCYKSPTARLRMGLMDTVRSQLSSVNGAAVPTIGAPKESKVKIQDNSTPAVGVLVAACALGENYVLPDGVIGEFSGTSKNVGFFQTEAGPVKLGIDAIVAAVPAVVVEAPKVTTLPAPWTPKLAAPIIGKPAAAAIEEPAIKRGRGRPPKAKEGEVAAPMIGAKPVSSVAAVAAAVEKAVVARTAAITAAAEIAAVSGIRLFINCIPNGPFTMLDKYVSDATRALEENFGVSDVRAAPQDSPLGYGKWEGVLAALVRAELPPDGVYVAITRGNRLTEIVVEALVPMCGPNVTRAI